MCVGERQRKRERDCACLGEREREREKESLRDEICHSQFIPDLEIATTI